MKSESRYGIRKDFEFILFQEGVYSTGIRMSVPHCGVGERGELLELHPGAAERRWHLVHKWRW